MVARAGVTRSIVFSVLTRCASSSLSARGRVAASLYLYTVSLSRLGPRRPAPRAPSLSLLSLKLTPFIIYAFGTDLLVAQEARVGPNIRLLPALQLFTLPLLLTLVGVTLRKQGLASRVARRRYRYGGDAPSRRLVRRQEPARGCHDTPRQAAEHVGGEHQHNAHVPCT